MDPEGENRVESVHSVRLDRVREVKGAAVIERHKVLFEDGMRQPHLRQQPSEVTSMPHNNFQPDNWARANMGRTTQSNMAPSMSDRDDIAVGSLLSARTSVGRGRGEDLPPLLHQSAGSSTSCCVTREGSSRELPLNQTTC